MMDAKTARLWTKTRFGERIEESVKDAMHRGVNETCLWLDTQTDAVIIAEVIKGWEADGYKLEWRKSSIFADGKLTIKW